MKFLSLILHILLTCKICLVVNGASGPRHENYNHHYTIITKETNIIDGNKNTPRKMTMKKDPDPNQLCFNQCRQLLLESNDDTESSSSSTSQFPDPCEEGFMVSCIHTHYIFFGSLPNFKLNKARNACLQLRKEEQCKKQRDNNKNTRYLRQSRKGNTTISEEKCMNMCSIDTEGAM
jgi:hypothetical protein